MELEVSVIRRDGGTQPRALINPFQVDEYAADMAAGATFPPVVVFNDGSEYWLADGFHRVAAAEKAGFRSVCVDVRQGTRRDAVLYSVGANSAHGLRRTNEDKHRAVLTLLQDEEWRQWSNVEIARRCGVSHTFVNSLRSLETVSSDARTYTTKHGTVAVMNTAAIGRQSLADEVYEKAPERVKTAVVEGDLTLRQAFSLTKALAAAGPRTRALAEKAGLDDAELIGWLSDGEAAGREWFEEIEASGFIQPGDEETAVGLRDGVRALEGAVKARARLHRQLANQARHARPFPTGKFRVIYVDPPWPYDNSGFEQSAEGQYPTMSLEAIRGLPVAELATDESALFLWATSPFLSDAMQVIQAWGATYKASLVWDKGRGPGLGWFADTHHELLLVATWAGNLHPLYRPPSVQRFAPLSHSTKPDEWRALVEAMYGGPYVELFARSERPGWTTWGNE